MRNSGQIGVATLKQGLLLGVLAAAQVNCVGCAGKADRAPKASAAPVVGQAPAPQQSQRPGVAKRGTLYERLGGETVIRAVVNDLVATAAADPAVNFSRQGHGDARQGKPQHLDRLKQALVAYFTTTAGGPEQYRGSDMVTAHRGMAISNSEFNAFTAHLADALDKNGVGRREKEELLRAVDSTRAAIVEAPDARPAEAPKADAADAPRPQSNDPAPDAAHAEVDRTDVAPEAAPPADAAPQEVMPAETNHDDVSPVGTPAEDAKSVDAEPSEQPRPEPTPSDEPIPEEYEPEANS